MISIKRLASALFLALCCSAYSNAQTVNVDGTTSTGNLIDNSQWTGVTYAPNPNDCCSNPGGSQPLYDTTDNTIRFSYGQATVGQIIGINNALGSTGLQVNGYSWSYEAKTTSQNGGGSDPLTSYSFLKDGNGAVLLSNTIQHAPHDWQIFGGTQTLNNPYDISGGGTVGIQFSGYDQGYWAGLYGPQVRNVDLRLNYTVGQDPCIKDPLSSTSCPGYAEAYKSQQCSINPLYDTSCPGYAQAYFDQQCSLNPLYNQACPGYAQAYYNQQCSYNPLYDTACPGRSAVITSGNLVPNPGTWHRAVNQSYAINTALSHGGAGLQVHAFSWGFQTFGFLGAGDFKSDVNIRDSNGDSIYSFSTGWQNVGGGYNDRSYYYQLPQSRNNLTLGTFEYNTEVTGLAAVGNFWARMLYTPDSCSLDPLSSPLCSKYEEAFLAQQCAIYVMYSPQCPGYADALAKMLEEQQALLASTTSTTSTDPTSTNTGSNTGSTGTTSSAATGTQDPTKTDATVTTDVGGVELSTTGEIVVADSVPSTVKEAAKESTKTPEASTTETKSASVATSSTEKKTANVNAVALAMAAVRETEATARATAEAAVAQSQSAAANPQDGTGASVNLGGITLAQLRAVTTAGQDQASQTAVNRAAQQAVTSSRALSADTEAVAVSNDRRDEVASITTNDPLQNTVNQTVSVNYSLINKDEEDRFEDKNKTAGTGLAMPNMAVLPAIPQEPVTPTGPSVRRGGAVDGMSGGDMNGLAAAPANFNDYLGKQLQDAQFYAAKDIYRNQKNVDNARALRGLGTDRLHQQMVDQQYNISGQ